MGPYPVFLQDRVRFKNVSHRCNSLDFSVFIFTRIRVIDFFAQNCIMVTMYVACIEQLTGKARLLSCYGCVQKVKPTKQGNAVLRTA